MNKEDEISQMLRDLIKINSIIATELIQLVENSSRGLRGDIPESCKIQHNNLKKEIVEIAERWNNDCEILKEHNLKHS